MRSSGSRRGNARVEAARLVGVSPRTVQEAKRLTERAPDLARQVRNGATTLHVAARDLDEPIG
jgi:hypothetical protein